jgi:hypothetical protein
LGTSQTDRCNKGCQRSEIRALAGFTIWLPALLHARGGDVLRVKGTVTTPAGRLLVQGVRVAMQPPEILPADHTAVADTIEDAEWFPLEVGQYRHQRARRDVLAHDEVWDQRNAGAGDERRADEEAVVDGKTCLRMDLDRLPARLGDLNGIAPAPKPRTRR